MNQMKYLIFSLLICFGINTNGQTPIFVKDINPGPFGCSFYSYPHMQIEDVIYFVGDISGKRDLYSIKNGQVELISQMCSVSCDFFDVFLFRFADKLYFTKKIDSKIYQLWSSDGSASGTNLVLEYPGTFNSFGVGNNGKVYLNVRNNSYIDEVFISDGTSHGTKKISSNVRLGSDEEAFGAPITYGNGIAFAGITNDSLMLFTYDDEKLELLNSTKVSKDSDIFGLKSIYSDDVVILVHSDNALSSNLYKYDSQTKKINKEMELPFTLQRFPNLKDFKKDSLVLFNHSGGHFLLTGKPLTTFNITPYSNPYFNTNKAYYTYNGQSAYLTKDANASFGQESKFVLFDGDPEKKMVTIVDDSNSPGLIGFKDYVFFKVDDPVFKAGEITLFNLKNKTSKQLFKFKQNFSSNSIKLLGLQGSKLYFLANLNEAFGKELYSIETGIPTSTQEVSIDTEIPFKIILKGTVFKIESEEVYSKPLNIGFFDVSGKLAKLQLMYVNTEYLLDESLCGLYFVRILDLDKIHSKSVPFFIP